MGAYLRGEALQLGGNGYKIIKDVVRSKVNTTYVEGTSKTQISCLARLEIGEFAKITINYENILLSDDLYFSNISTIDSIDISKFEFENAYLCYISSDTKTTHIYKYTNVDWATISFDIDEDNKQLIITTTLTGVAPSGTSPTNGISYGGISGLLKYDGKYVFYSTNSAIKYGEASNGYSSGANFGSIVKTPKSLIADGESWIETVEDVELGGDITYKADSSETIGYFLSTYFGTGKSSTGDLTGETVVGDNYFSKILTIALNSRNRRIVNA